MSKQISIQAAKAFAMKDNFKKSNTEVKGDEMFLFGNLIAKVENHNIYISLAGWATSTTKERLNAILDNMGLLNGVHSNHKGIYTKKGITYLDNAAMDENTFYKVT